MKSKKRLIQKFRSGAVLASLGLTLIITLSRCSPLSPSISKSELEQELAHRATPILRNPLQGMQINARLKLMDRDAYLKAITACSRAEGKIKGLQSVTLDSRQLEELREARHTTITLTNVSEATEAQALAESILPAEAEEAPNDQPLQLRRLSPQSWEINLLDPDHANSRMQNVQSATLVVRDSDASASADICEAVEESTLLPKSEASPAPSPSAAPSPNPSPSPSTCPSAAPSSSLAE